MYNNTNLFNSHQDHWESYPTLDELICKPNPFEDTTVNEQYKAEMTWDIQNYNQANHSQQFHHNHPLSAQFSAHKRKLMEQQQQQALSQLTANATNVKSMTKPISKKKIGKPKKTIIDLRHNPKYLKALAESQGNHDVTRIARTIAQSSLEEVVESMKIRHRNNEHNYKPPYAYAILILIALLQNDQNRLTLSQIYKWVSTRFPYFDMSNTTWQNSIRHNLSLNPAFIKTVKSPDKRSYYWEFKQGQEHKFFKDLSLPFQHLKMVIKSLDQYFFPVTVPPVQIKIDSPEKDFTKPKENNNNPLPTPPNTDDHTMAIGLGPAFDIVSNTPPKSIKSEKSRLKINSKNDNDPSIYPNNCSIDERLDALRTPEFKNHESLICSPLTPNKIESIHNSNMIFFQIWNQDHNF
ncbi:hypothetical protein C6P45_005022 [Maudiozyma exigua]|uniref:Fork-head domain-containing protein n=1 Tax=Maudiozyma exigua TaxID=34358 RepID=A0A9P6WF42_MAUEX|nr:hypothetical protein C6P45_005022 [Kazachstania exigua]